LNACLLSYFREFVLTICVDGLSYFFDVFLISDCFFLPERESTFVVISPILKLAQQLLNVMNEEEASLNVVSSLFYICVTVKPLKKSNFIAALFSFFSIFSKWPKSVGLFRRHNRTDEPIRMKLQICASYELY
jgi:hypothetical protein